MDGVSYFPYRYDKGVCKEQRIKYFIRSINYPVEIFLSFYFAVASLLTSYWF